MKIVMASVLNFILSLVSFFLIGLVLSLFGGDDGSGSIGLLWLLLFLIPEVVIILYKINEVFSFLFAIHLATVLFFMPIGIALNLMISAITGVEPSSEVTIIGGTVLMQLISTVLMIIVEKKYYC